MNTLVVVDDETLVTDFLTFILQNEGHTVHTASNGKEALDVITRTQPDLVVTDFMMPIMSGVELATRLRETDVYRNLPVILCSSVPDAVKQDDRRLFSSVLQKPFAPQRLISLIAQQLKASGDDGASDGA